MRRARTNERQGLLPIDLSERYVRRPEGISLHNWPLGKYVGNVQGKNIYVALCDRCHEPGIEISGRWYHAMPCERPCTLASAPHPSGAALARLRAWYQWAQDTVRKRSTDERVRLVEIEQLVYPMRVHLLDQLVRSDRRHLPSVSECMLIRRAMERTELESGIEPLEIESWKDAVSTSAT